MLNRTFIHVPGIGERRERGLWSKGYTDWERFRRTHPDGAWKALIESRLDLPTAARDLPRREAWRLLSAYPGKTAYLDIETEGLGVERNRVTCVGLSDGDGVAVFVRGKNLEELPAAMERFELVVTYNGSCFDLPILERSFPDAGFGRLRHVDLRYPLRRLGFRGGLKQVERDLGLSRADEVRGVDGFMAVLLWRAHLEGRPTALETLIRYCLEDVVHLKPLAAHVYNRLSGAMPLEVAPVTDTTAPGIPYEADGDLVHELLGGGRGARGYDPWWAP